jgi:hypothetical protein
VGGDDKKTTGGNSFLFFLDLMLTDNRGDDKIRVWTEGNAKRRNEMLTSLILVALPIVAAKLVSRLFKN